MTQHQTRPDLPHHQPSRRPRLWLWIALGVAALAIAGLIAWYWPNDTSAPPPSPADTVTIQGHITVPAETLYSQGFKGGDCTSDAGFTDIAAGAQVTITDQSGTVIRTGALNGGHTSATLPDLNGGDDFANKCSYHFLIDGVPGDAANYGVSVGNTFRGTVHFNREQLRTAVDLNLG